MDMQGICFFLWLRYIFLPEVRARRKIAYEMELTDAASSQVSLPLFFELLSWQ